MEYKHCPECGNEIYKPYEYCNACGWEKGEGEEEELKEVEAEGKAKKKGKKKEKEEKVKTKAAAEKKPIKIKCKCGASIKVKSTKRPLTIECPKCGRKGTIKAPPTTEKPDKAKKPEKPKKPEKTPTPKQEAQRPLDKKGKKRSDLKSKSRPDKIPGKKGGAPKKHERPKRDREKFEEEYCPDCGTRLGMTGLCPKCGYRSGPGPSYGAREATGGRRKSKHKPPKGAREIKPKKGICSKCNSKNLRFYDDGSGRCGNCGREFRWDGGASRMQEDEYECQKCGDLLEWIEDYQRWYCHTCEEYQ